ncbi:MAG: c-type cytochrome biogenesis protein CcmI [Thiomargarita sp.]|nr:c-type cytochrome biogenesis protein CcmI [Thiomargarita sp.]
MIIIALAFVIPAFLKREIKESLVDHDSLSIAIYKEQRAELEAEDLTSEQRIQSQQELDKSLAQNLDNETKPITQTRARWASILVMIAIPLFTVGMYWELGAWNLIAQETAKPITDTNEHHQAANQSDFSQLVDNLSARLKNQPDDTEGWMMLARSYMVMERYSEAVTAYNKLLDLVGKNDPQILSDLARATILTNLGKFAGQPVILLKIALNLDPNHQQSLWLMGLASVEKQDYPAAINYWEKLKVQLSEDRDAKTLKMVRTNIANARNQLGEEILSKPVESEPKNATIMQHIEVRVELAADLKERVNPDDTLFIYAKAVQGSAMPLAIVKKAASELPTQVVLDDSMAMTPTMKLSNFKEVIIMARISRSGKATTQSGDLVGQVSPVMLGTPNQVIVIINQIIE